MVAALARLPDTQHNVSAPASDVLYAHTHEDPALELELVETLAKELGRPLRVLVVASGGCTPLTLLSSPHVARVDAVDLNPAQLFLTELKRVAIDTLTLDEQRRLFGAEEATSSERLSLYERLRGDLTNAAREHWDARPEELAYGLGRVGRFEQLLEELAVAFHEEGLNPAERPAEAMGSDAWNGIFGRVFDDSRLSSELGTASVAYASELPTWQRISRSLAESLKRTSTQENYFLAHVFPSAAPASPPCLDPTVQDAIKRAGTHRLFLHRGPLIGRLEALAATGSFDLVQTSDVTDWLPREERRALVRTVASALTPGGAMLSRRLNGEGELAPCLARHLEVDAETSARFLQAERTFLYREVVVARKAT